MVIKKHDLMFTNILVCLMWRKWSCWADHTYWLWLKFGKFIWNSLIFLYTQLSMYFLTHTISTICTHIQWWQRLHLIFKALHMFYYLLTTDQKKFRVQNLASCTLEESANEASTLWVVDHLFYLQSHSCTSAKSVHFCWFPLWDYRCL